MGLLSSTAVSLALIGAGAATLMVVSRPLSQDETLHLPSNPMGLKGSPYGSVLAMAMQGSVDTYWHATEGGHPADCDDPAHQHSGNKDATVSASLSLNKRFSKFLDEIGHAAESRTNPKAASPAQKFAVRRAIENKLRFAYELDPSHYGNYVLYHFFLTEPEVGTRRVLTPAAIKLAEETIEYCLKQQDDPRPSLTAAAAAEHELELMFHTPDKYPVAEMRRLLTVIEHSMAMHHRIADEWKKSGAWEKLSVNRRDEIAARVYLITKLQEGYETTVGRLERGSMTRISF
jgi:hypothetical protein